MNQDRNFNRGPQGPGNGDNDSNNPNNQPPGGDPNNPQRRKLVMRRPYAGAARISHNGTEFVIDFGDLDPDNPKMIMMHAGVKMSPQTAKGLLIALRQNLSKYEAQYGKINYPPDDADDVPDWKKNWN